MDKMLGFAYLANHISVCPISERCPLIVKKTRMIANHSGHITKKEMESVHDIYYNNDDMVQHIRDFYRVSFSKK